MINHKKIKQQGFSLVELVIVIAIVHVSPHAVLSSSVETFRIKLDLLQELKSLLCNFAHK
jgi:Tfp pilus assembly protein PilE